MILEMTSAPADTPIIPTSCAAPLVTTHVKAPQPDCAKMGDPIEAMRTQMQQSADTLKQPPGRRKRDVLSRTAPGMQRCAHAHRSASIPAASAQLATSVGYSCRVRLVLQDLFVLLNPCDRSAPRQRVADHM